jgi:ferredoxin
MARPQWFVELLETFFPGRFAIARLTHAPLIGSLIDQGIFRGDDIIYLPRDETIQIHQPVASYQNIVLPSRVVEHFIEQSHYHWIMNFCICRESNGCRDYPVDLGCLFLGEAVLGINPKMGRLVSKEEALAHVARCRAAGLVHMVGRNKLDTIWLGVGPGEKLLTICNCCPCCCLWKMLPQLNPMIGEKVHKMPGVSVRVTDLCAGCGACIQGVCFVDAISLVDGRATISTECRACGRCVEVCPNQAIQILIEDTAFVQSTIERLEPLVDLS